MNNKITTPPISTFFHLLFFFSLFLAASLKTSAQNIELGSENFYPNVKTWMAANSKKILLGTYNKVSFAVIDADGYKLECYKTATAGHTIDNAISANPDAEIILNGALFNYMNQAPLLTTGLVVNGGQIISNTVNTPSDRPATLRYWIGQTNENSATYNAGQALSYRFGGKGHPEPIGNGSNQIGAAMGGLISLIWDKNGSPHQQTDTDDTDLRTYNSFRGGYIKAFGIIGIDRQTGLLIILAKPQYAYQSVYDTQSALFNSGTDRAILVDGSASVAFYIKTNGVVVRTSRHPTLGFIPSEETVASYITFKRL
jgi:hypothetical protein